MAFLTGVSSGLGREIAQEYLSQEWQVISFGRSMAYSTTHHFYLDLADRGSRVEGVINEAVSQFGLPDIVVCCAASGSVGQLGCPSTNTWIESTVDLVRVNALGHAVFAKACAAQMLSSKDASVRTIVFISSIAAHVPFPSLSSYCISKSAMEMVAKLVREEYESSNLRVILFRPGQMATDFYQKLSLPTPSGDNVNLPRDVAKALMRELESSTAADITVGSADADLLNSIWNTHAIE